MAIQITTPITANDPHRKSWVEVPTDSDYSIQNIPFGLYSVGGETKRACSAIGTHIIDLFELSRNGFFKGLPFDENQFIGFTLNTLMSEGKEGMRKLRNRVAELFDEKNTELQSRTALHDVVLKPMDSVSLHLPIEIGDYTDFYSSIEHATNVGTMFRDPNNALLPNWRHLPVGYHGRSSSIVTSGIPVRRPKGQTKPNEDQPPVFGPSKQLDFELEMAFITFDGKPLGQHIPVAEAEDHIFGLVLFNDWSARDIQKWEYVPLGPFLAKNFASSMSPWIVTLDALEPFRISGPKQEPEVLPYLQYQGAKNIDIALEVQIKPEGGERTVVSRSNFRYMYWNMAQQLAHHTVNGCNIRRGDTLASGTISGTDPSSYGSMLELSWKGTRPVQLSDGQTRKFIEDGDTVTMSGYCKKDGVRVGFGYVTTKVLPALE